MCILLTKSGVLTELAEAVVEATKATAAIRSFMVLSLRVMNLCNVEYNVMYDDEQTQRQEETVHMICTNTTGRYPFAAPVWIIDLFAWQGDAASKWTTLY